MRKTRSKTGHQRSQKNLEEPTVTTGEGGVRHYPHRASAQTGTYRGRQVLDVEKKLAKQQRKQAASGDGDETSGA